jgi:riboflavin kinase/FMN adenylyltransferase
MFVVRTFEELARRTNKVCLAIGVFDGVHLGHQRVIGQARDDARVCGGSSVVLTFDPHPVRVLQPDRAPLLLTSTEHKLALIGALGVDACLLLTFDPSFAATPPEDFIATIAGKTHALQSICVGSRFRFGHNRAGDVRLIHKLAPQYGFTLKEIHSVTTPEGAMISSTAVRQHVLAGNLDAAAAMLGRAFSILGTVEHGDHRGREIGFPTANLNPHNEALPPDGVYAVRVLFEGKSLGGVVNIGVRPTFAGTARRLEVHIFDVNQGLYGRDIEVVFTRRLRDEKKFASMEELRAQIAADVAAARGILSR